MELVLIWLLFGGLTAVVGTKTGHNGKPIDADTACHWSFSVTHQTAAATAAAATAATTVTLVHCIK
jgi:hypothetical protein